jgi:hypothetical protein
MKNLNWIWIFFFQKHFIGYKIVYMTQNTDLIETSNFITYIYI